MLIGVVCYNYNRHQGLQVLDDAMELGPSVVSPLGQLCKIPARRQSVPSVQLDDHVAHARKEAAVTELFPCSRINKLVASDVRGLQGSGHWLPAHAGDGHGCWAL